MIGLPSAVSRVEPVRLAAFLAALVLLAGPALAAEPPEIPRILSGVTLDGLGRAVANVDIVVSPVSTGAAGPLHTARSDEQGRFRLSGLEPGAYRVVAIKGGYSILVGQIDTLLRNSLELVLRPSGEAGAPGTRPADNGWALRLASRDRLESITQTVGTIARARPVDSRVIDGPLLVELQSSRLVGDDAAGGIAAAVAAEMPLDGFGEIGLTYQHRSESDPDLLAEDSDIVNVRWLPDAELAGAVPALEMSAVRRSRLDTAYSASAPIAQYRAEGARFESTWVSLDPGRAFEVRLDGTLLQGEQSAGFEQGEAWQGFDAYRVGAAVAWHRAWSERHETVTELRARTTSGALINDGSRTRVLALMAATDGTSALGGLDGETVGLSVVDRWRLGRGVAIHSRWRAERESAIEDSLRLAAGFGGRWEAPRGFALEAEAGLTFGDAAPQRLWKLALARARGDWHWSVGRARETGLAPWEDDGGLTHFAASPIVTDAEGQIDRWFFEAGWTPAATWPEIVLSGEVYDIAGRMALMLPDDLPLVPMTGDGRGSGSQVELLVRSSATGTWVSISWAEVEDHGPRMELLGAPLWRHQELSLRQRLGRWGVPGGSWHVLVNYEDGSVPKPSLSTERTRIAMLDRRRVSGGLAVIF